MHIRYNNGTPTEYPQIPKVWKNISGFNHLSSEVHKQHGFYPMVEVRPPVDWVSHLQEGPVYTLDEMNGQVIATWVNVPRNLEKVKAERIAELEAETTAKIYATYPLHKQLNRPMETVEAQTAMNAFITAHIEAFRAARTEVQTKTACANVKAVTIIWPV